MADLRWLLVVVAAAIIACFVLDICRLPQLPAPVAVDIAVEEIDANWRADLGLARELPPALTKVRPRLVFAGAANLASTALVYSHELVAAVGKVASRIMIEGASTNVAWGLSGSADLISVAAEVAPRIVVEGATTSSLNQDLQGSADLVAATAKVGPRLLIEGAPTGQLQTMEGPPCIPPCPPP
jgi:hypothetical protein